MAPPPSARPHTNLLNGQSLALAAALLLPCLAPSIFGWISGLLAIPVFCLLCLYGQEKGTLFIRNGIIVAAVAAIILKLLPSLFFSLTMVPLGYSFSKSHTEGGSEMQAGARGALVLSVSWLVFWSGYGAVEDVNPYRHLLDLLDVGLAQTYGLYAANADLPAEGILQLEQAVRELRRIIPLILPGMLAGTVLITVWLNLALSRNLMARLRPDQMHWERFSRWHLPDKLVWFLIAGGISLLVGQEKLNQIGLGMLITTSLLFFFQGLAVFIHFLEKWKVPVYVRILIYGILLLQSFGLIVLTIVGLADVWFHFRQRQPIDNPNGS